MSLPIESIKSELETVIRQRKIFVLTAPTGSGKSTAVPAWIFDWLPDTTIYVLQPRRLPARMLAGFVAGMKACSLGEFVGYQVRFDHKVSSKTRLIYVTEGLLLRKLLSLKASDKPLYLLFDEFHERHLEADVALGLALKKQREGMPIQLGVLSATLDPQPLLAYLEDSVLLESEGRQFPVTTSYLGEFGTSPVEEKIEKALIKALKEGAEGDFLIFLPGRFEIDRTHHYLSQQSRWKAFEILRLFGDLPPEEQDKVVRPGNAVRIILSTNIAETSITLPRLKTVIDFGYARIPSYDARRGINALTVEKISRASADQRAGRAGRVAPGRCYRLWTESDHSFRSPATPPEIKRLDLSEMLLQLSTSIESPAKNFPFYERPDAQRLEVATQLLEDLGAWKKDAITDVGKRMAVFPLHPRYSRILLFAAEKRCLSPILLILALAQSRSILTPPDQFWNSLGKTEAEALSGSDFFIQMEAWKLAHRENFNHSACRENGIHSLGALTVGRVYQQLESLVRASLNYEGDSEPIREDDIRKCLLVGFPDHLAIRKDRGTLTCLLPHGKSGVLARSSVVDQSPLFVSAELEEREFRGQVTLFLQQNTSVEESWLSELFPEDYRINQMIRLNSQTKRIECVEQTLFRDLVLREKESQPHPNDQTARLLAETALAENWVLKKWDHAVENWIRRCNVLAKYAPELEISPIEDADRLLFLEQICDGALSYKDIKDRPVFPIIKQWLSEPLLPLLDDWVPERFELNQGFKPKLRYEGDGTVVLAAKIQQLYDTPQSRLTICQGRCPLRIEILAPNFRPVQITDNLDNFWTQSYPQIKKDLYGRYPKHEWR